jgi:hypothetical protein
MRTHYHWAKSRSETSEARSIALEIASVDKDILALNDQIKKIAPDAVPKTH